jgi:hypothetical protein
MWMIGLRRTKSTNFFYVDDWAQKNKIHKLFFLTWMVGLRRTKSTNFLWCWWLGSEEQNSQPFKQNLTCV